jgi:hypothetical protein
MQYTEPVLLSPCLIIVSTSVTSTAYTEIKWCGPAQGKCFSVCSLWTSTLGSCNVMCYINYAKPRSIHMQITMHIYSPLFEYLSVNSRLHLLACTAQLVFGRSFVLACLLSFSSTHCSLKAYCAILVRRSNFRHQASPRVSPRESTQRRKVELWARKCPVILPKCRFLLYI